MVVITPSCALKIPSTDYPIAMLLMKTSQCDPIVCYMSPGWHQLEWDSH